MSSSPNLTLVSPASDSSLRVRQLAAAFECITEDDLLLLAKVETSTLQTWRKRGEGPSYILLGTRYLYPIESVASYLKGKVRHCGPDRAGAGDAL